MLVGGPEWAIITSWKDALLPVQYAVMSSSIRRLGQSAARYGLVVVLAWIGVGKFVKMEAHVLIEHNPLMSWIYLVLSHSAVAMALGTAEILAAVADGLARGLFVLVEERARLLQRASASLGRRAHGPGREPLSRVLSRV